MPLHLNWSSSDISLNFRCFWQLTEMAVWLPSYILLIGSRWGPFATEAHQVQHQAKSVSRKRTVPRQTKTGEKCKFWRCKVRETRRDRHSTLRQGRYDLLEDRHRLRRTKRALETWALFLWHPILNLVGEISEPTGIEFSKKLSPRSWASESGPQGRGGNVTCTLKRVVVSRSLISSLQ